MDIKSSMRQAVRSAALKATGASPDTLSLKQHLKTLLPASMQGGGDVPADDVARLHAASQAQKLHQLSGLYDSVVARLATLEAERDAVHARLDRLEAANTGGNAARGQETA